MFIKSKLRSYIGKDVFIKITACVPLTMGLVIFVKLYQVSYHSNNNPLLR